jgi:DNA primase
MLSYQQLGESVRSKGDQLFFNCPFCNEIKGKLGVNLKKKIYHCFHCNVSGRVKDLPITTTRDFNHYIENKLIKKMKPVEQKIYPKLPNSCFKISETKTPRAFKYLIKRGITKNMIEKYNLNYCYEDIYMSRIIVPVYENAELVYFLGRSITPRVPKYLNSAIPKGGTVFKTFTGKVEQAVICEGVFDAMKIGEVLPAICLLGKKATPQQMKTILECVTDKIFVMLDRDAFREGMELSSMLSLYIKSKFLLIDYKDPGEMTTQQIKEVLR